MSGMKSHRLRAPSADGSLLAVPPPSDVGSQLSRARERLDGWNHDFQGRRAPVLRAQVQREVLSASRSYLERHGLDVPDVRLPSEGEAVSPLIVTGHQPELFHPGVWVKNFATAAIARRYSGHGLNLIVDNDLPKSSTIRVPRVDATRIRSVRVEFDHWLGEVPYEELKVHDEGLFSSFPRRVHAVLGSSIPDPVLDEFWPRALCQAGVEASVGTRLAVARRALEGAWGVSNLEIPLSDLCQTDGFLWFVSHILAQLPRFQEIHNSTLVEYRKLYGIRSKNHPVSALGVRGEWREAPFWIWRHEEPRRRALLVRQHRRTMELRIAGEDATLLELPLAPDREACCAVERLRELAGRSVRLRTRALTTTLFSRYLLGDLFIHGIGGAKYDELGDSIAHQFFGIEPPEFLTLSMTLWLGLPERPTAENDLASIHRQIRDIEYHPERFLAEPMTAELRRIVEEKRAVVRSAPTTRHDRVARFRTIRRLNESIHPFVQAQRDILQARSRQVSADLEWNRHARSREYSFVLHSTKRLHDVMMGLQHHFDRSI
jgi:hypothetical protein